jgi:conjugal transfer mating pair stabilization protein TraN
MTIQKGIGALTGAAEAAARTESGLAVDGFAPSAFGFGFTFGSIPAGAASLGTIGGANLFFDPTSFAISVGIMILQDLLSCDQQEQILAMRQGQNLCREIGTFCSRKLPIVKICIEKTKSYCCYNSRLARIINEQGRAQIGKSWGSPESPNCSGFTPSEFSALDFSKMDLSEFMSEITANVNTSNLAVIPQGAPNLVQQKMQSYYQRGSQ